MKPQPDLPATCADADEGTPVSVKIRERIEAARKRFNANDNIAEFIQPGELEQLLDEVSGKMQGVLDSLPEVIDSALHGVLVHATLRETGLQADVEQALTQAGITVRSIEPTLPSLEDVFITMVAQRRAEVEGARAPEETGD